jgi:hypothetical protein
MASRSASHAKRAKHKEIKMKVVRDGLPVILFALSTVAFAQSDARPSFDKMKLLAGEWDGTVTTVPPEPAIQGKTAQVTIRVTSRGNAVLHDMKISGIPDNPITIFYLDSDRLLLTHYCDAGNRPRMVGKPASDGKTLEFEFLDVAGGNEKGHMHNAMLSMIDPERHIEEWTYMSPDGKGHVVAHFDLRRKK